jgi:class 3 adenylate cyclase
VSGQGQAGEGITCEDRGEQALKGVGEPVRVWAVYQERRRDYPSYESLRTSEKGVLRS